MDGASLRKVLDRVVTRVPANCVALTKSIPLHHCPLCPTQPELMKETRPEDKHIHTCGVPTIKDETWSLLKLLPPQLADELRDHTERLSEVSMDKGRPPMMWLLPNGERILMEGIVTEENLEYVTNQLEFGSDNRACVEGQLHRVSRIPV